MTDIDVPAYRLRFFFEYRGECLWSGDDRTRVTFGYPVALHLLPLSDATVSEIHRLTSWFGDSLNWDYPPDPGPWRRDECDRFNRAAVGLLERIRSDLGRDYDVVSEQGELTEDPELDRNVREGKGFRR